MPQETVHMPTLQEAGVYDERTTTHLRVCPKVEINMQEMLATKSFRCDESDHPLSARMNQFAAHTTGLAVREKPLRKDLSQTRAECSASPFTSN